MEPRKFSLDAKKWQQPGWRIEQRYSRGVLIGNWAEDRHKFLKGNEFANSTSRDTFREYSSHSYKPDASTRRKGLLRNDGLGKDQLFTHHGNRYMNNSISLYDQTFNKRYSVGRRLWDGKRLAWLPEASDHPMEGEGTKFGLKKQIEEKWRRNKQLEEHGDFTSTSKLSYREPPQGAYVTQRAATCRDLSARTHPQDMNRDLHLRNARQTLIKETVDLKLLSFRSDQKISATL